MLLNSSWSSNFSEEMCVSVEIETLSTPSSKSTLINPAANRMLSAYHT